MAIIDDLVGWNAKWTLRKDLVSCKYCNAAQVDQAREQPFVHFSHCQFLACAIENPWLDLSEILKRIPVAAPVEILV